MRLKFSIYSKEFRADPDSGNRASVMGVASQVNAVLPTVSKAPDPAAAFANCMAGEWGNKVSTTASGIYYEYIWDVELQQWVWRCFETSVFEVAYAAGDTVVVDFATVRDLSA